MSQYPPTPPSEPALSAKQATIYIPTRIHPKIEEYARTKFAKVVQPSDTPEEECLRLADGIVSRVGDLREKQLSQAKRLKMIARNGTGCDNIDLNYCKQHEIIVVNNPGGNAATVAELALTLALSVVRRVKEMDRRITGGERVPSIDALSGSLLHATVGLIGMGDTAYEFAKMLTPFKCRIIAYSPTSPKNRWTSPDDRYPHVIEHERAESLEDMLKQVDLLSLHCPLTPSTRNMLGEKEFKAMKPSAVIINCARGGILDEAALAQALKRGELAGAGLDVFATEPAYGDNLGELGKMNNVICLPHLAGSTEQVQYEGCKVAVDILADFFDGKGYMNRVV